MAFRFLKTTFSVANQIRCQTVNRLQHNRLLSQDSRVWRLGKLNHVAIAVKDLGPRYLSRTQVDKTLLEQACSLYRNVFGATVSEAHPQPDHGVYTVFVELGETKIELISPLGDKSPIEGFLDKKPEGGIHHICFNVADINRAMEDLKANNIRVLNPTPKIGAHGKPVVFLHPKDCGGVLVELEMD